MVGSHLDAVFELGVRLEAGEERRVAPHDQRQHGLCHLVADDVRVAQHAGRVAHGGPGLDGGEGDDLRDVVAPVALGRVARSEEHTSELQSLMRISYAVFCFKKKREVQLTACTDEHTSELSSYIRKAYGVSWE